MNFKFKRFVNRDLFAAKKMMIYYLLSLFE